MGGPTIEPEKVRYRELVAWTRRKQGKTQGQIAAELGISQAAVSKILRRVDRRTLKRLERDVQLVKVKQAGRLDELYEEAMAAWHRSKSKIERTVKRSGARGREEVTETRSTAGDPRFLTEARALLEAERRLWGLEDAARPEPEPKPRTLEGDREALRALLGTLTRRMLADMGVTGLAGRPDESMGQLPPALEADLVGSPCETPPGSSGGGCSGGAEGGL